jgi:hypothetical protein
MSARGGIAILSCVAGALLLATPPAYGVELRLAPTILGQVRDGDGYLPGDTEAPIELYGDFGLSDLPHGTTLDTYFRLEEDFANLSSGGQTQFFSGVLRVPAAPPGLDVQLGRQIVAESPVNVWDADSGQIRVGLGGPFSLTVFGGQPRYWEPTYSSPSLSQNEQIFGGSLRVAQFQGGAVAIGYLQQMRQGLELMQQITATGARSFATLPGQPNLYGNFAFDADHQNIDRVRAGVQSFVWKPTLLFNLESTYYKPQDNGKILIQDINRREDPIFQLYSLSQALQFRGGLRYALTRTVSTYGDLSYQRYQQLAGSYINGYDWSAGVLYLPGGDGLESVRFEYYGIQAAGGRASGTGNVNGARATYENRVYERVLFRANCDVAYYQKWTNQDGTAFATLLGLGYVLLPGLVAEVNFQANRNQFFPEDFRFGFFISYNADYRVDGGVQRSYVGNQGRPWPWGVASFGPASWGPGKAVWTADPGLPAAGWAANAVAADAALGRRQPAATAGGAPAEDGDAASDEGSGQ